MDAKLNYAEWLAENGRTSAHYQQGLELLDDYAEERPETVLWYQTAANLHEETGNPKQSKKYHKKARQLAKKMGWEQI